MRDVAYVLAEYPVVSQTFVHAEISALRAEGVQVDVIAHRRGSDQVRFGRGADGRPIDVSFVGLDREGVEVVLRSYHHLHAHFADFGVRVLAPLAAKAGRPWSCTAHAYDIFRADSAVRPDEWKALHGECRRVVTISRFHRDFLISRGVDPARISVIPNAARLSDLLTGAPPAPTRLRKILAVGRPVAKKGFPVLVQAWARVRTAAPEVELTIIGGEGLVESPPPGLHLTPMLPYDEVLTAMAECDLVVAPSVVTPQGDMDGIPTVLVEAAALRRPVIASAVSGVGDLVADGVNGLLVAPNDVDALVGAILRLWARPAELTRLGSGGPVLAAAHDARRVAARLRTEVFDA